MHHNFQKITVREFLKIYWLQYFSHITVYIWSHVDSLILSALRSFVNIINGTIPLVVSIKSTVTLVLFLQHLSSKYYSFKFINYHIIALKIRSTTLLSHSNLIFKAQFKQNLINYPLNKSTIKCVMPCYTNHLTPPPVGFFILDLEGNN